jgi:hypothetical protein
MQALLTLFDVRLKCFNCVANGNTKVHSLAMQIEQSIGDARDVQRLFDKLTHAQNLPLDQRLQGKLRATRMLTQESDGIAHCTQRASQFVRQQRKELVLSAICGRERPNLQLREQQQ